ncbi:hypothetical protein K438DRAFT_1751506 [Mycena galopus ATCC 62051]|nr:hypothetical protein K438DRAFT_1751506 [Mycena galopus ATCC 62051]
MSSGVELEVNRRKPGADRELTGGYRNVNGCIPEYTGSGRMRNIGAKMNQKHPVNRKVSPEVTKGVRWMRPESPDMKEDRRLRLDEPDAEARSHVQRRQCRRAISQEKPECERGPEYGSLNSRCARLLTDKQFRWSGGGKATEVDIGGGRIAASAKGVRVGGRETSGKRRAKPEAPNLCRSPSRQSSQHGRDEQGWQRAESATEVAEEGEGEDSPKVTITGERTSPIARPEVVSEIVVELFRLRNLLHVCSTVEPERTEVMERRFGGRNFRVGIWHKRKP